MKNIIIICLTTFILFILIKKNNIKENYKHRKHRKHQKCSDFKSSDTCVNINKLECIWKDNKCNNKNN
jgi:hypothetical protein